MHFRHLTSIRLIAGLILIGLLALAAIAGPRSGPTVPEAHDALREYVNDVTAQSPLQYGRLTVVPLHHPDGGRLGHVQGHPSLLDVRLQGVRDDVAVLRLRNDTSRPILATAGRVVYAEDLEAVLPHDVLVPAHGFRDIEVVPLRHGGVVPEPGSTLAWHPRWSPTAVSKRLALGDDVEAPRTLIRRHTLEGSGAPTLRGLLSSARARELDGTLARVLHDPTFRDPSVVGFVLGIDGHPVGLHLFGGATLHRAKAAGLLASFGLHAHALETHVADLGSRPKDGREAVQAVGDAARDLLRTLQAKSRFVYGPDRQVTVLGPGVRGFGSVHGGAPLHLTLKPADALEARLFEPADGA